MKLSIFILLFSFGLTLSVTGQITYTSVASNNWNNQNTWNPRGVPGANDHAIITNGFNVTIVQNTSVGDLTINEGGILTGNGNLTIGRNIVVDGIYTGSGAINLSNPSSLQTISGNGTISNTSTITVTGNRTILTGSNLTVSSANILINGTYTITNNGNFTTGGLISGTVAASTWTNGSNSILNIGGVPANQNQSPLLQGVGTLNASATGNIVNYFSPTSVTIKLPSVVSGYATYHHLHTTGTNVKFIPDGDLAINGDLVNSSTLNGSGPLKKIFLRGNWINNGNFTEGSGTGTVTFDGSADQTLFRSAAENLNILVVNKPSGSLILNTNVVAETGLTLLSGNIVTGPYKLTLGLNITNSGTLTRTSGRIIGRFERWIKGTDVGIPIEFPIGTSSFDRPVTIRFSSLTPGSLLTEFISTAPGNNLSPKPLVENGVTLNNTFRDGYWSLSTPNTLDTLQFNLELTGNGFTGFPINDNTRMLTRSITTNPWVLQGNHVIRNGNTVKRNNLATLGQFCFGSDASCLAPATSAITGASSVCLNELASAYSVVNTPGSVYTWTIVGGTQVSGGTSNSIVVNWGSTGAVGSVTVVEDNGCTLGAEITLPVNVNPIPTATITGKVNVPQNELPNPPFESANENYTVAAQVGYTFTWSVTGGTIVSISGTTRTATISWGPAGTGQVCVQGIHACGTSISTCLTVNIYEVITSVRSGNWNSQNTWSCSCVPGVNDNISILPTHTVNVDANGGIGRTIKNVNIFTNGILNTNANPLTITGDLNLNGFLRGTGSVSLTGAGTILDGLDGKLENSSPLIINGNKTVLPTALLEKVTGNVSLGAGTIITNFGNVTLRGDLIGGDDASTWINKSNSSLTIGGVLLSTGELIASEAQNSIAYNGSGIQSIKTPNDDQYYNLILTGTGQKNLPSLVLNLAGDFTNDASLVSHNNGTISFNGISALLGSVTPLLNSVTVQSDASFTLTNALDLNGNFQNNGIFIPGPASLISFLGTANQNISGSTVTDFKNLLINKTAGAVRVQSNQNLTGILTVNAGTFDADGTNNTSVFTIKSFNDRPTNEGSIGVISPGGSVTGNVTVERYISAQGRINRYISSPIANILVSQLQDDFSITGPFTGTSFPCTGCANNLSSLRFYDESVGGTLERGYKGYPLPGGSNTESLEQGRGYLAFMHRNITFTWDLRGTINQGDVSLPVNYTASSAGIENDGWNLVGNPYPSSIRWTADDWDRTNIDPVISVSDLSKTTVYPNYFWTYNYEDNTGDLPGGIIAMGQAFWVKANGSNPSLTIRETAKTGSGSGNFYRTASPSEQLVISINNGKYEDRSYLKLNPEATESFDNLFDGYKLKNEFMNVYLIDEDNRDLVMHTVREINREEFFPIGVDVASPGIYTLRFDNLSNFSAGHKLYFIDAYEDVVEPLANLKDYSFTITDNQQSITDRFYLSLNGTSEGLLKEQISLYPNPVKQKLNVRVRGIKEPIRYILFDFNGKEVRKGIIDGDSTLEMHNYPSGLYILQINTSKGVLIKKIIKSE